MAKPPTILGYFAFGVSGNRGFSFSIFGKFPSLQWRAVPPDSFGCFMMIYVDFAKHFDKYIVTYGVFFRKMANVYSRGDARFPGPGGARLSLLLNPSMCYDLW